MTESKRIGIWMDHSIAHILRFPSDNEETNFDASTHINLEKDQNHGSSEHVMNNRESHSQSAFYKELVDIIRNFDEVVLFGPTDAKFELFNIVRASHQFEHIKMDVITSDKMTENQLHVFVNNHFKGN
jgi:hypothetical protein